MRRRRGGIALLATIAVVVLAAAACSSSGSSGSSSASGGSSSSTLQSVLSSHTLTVGLFQSLPPLETINSSGQAVGMDVDIANMLAQSLGAKLDIVTVTAANRIAEVETGKVDVLLTAAAITDERAQVVAFTRPYTAAGTALITLKSDNINSVADMKGKTVGYATGEFYGPIAAKYLPNSHTQQFQTTTDELVALNNHQIAAFFSDSNEGAYTVSKDPALQLVNGNFGPLEYDGMVVQQGDQEWLNYLNTFIFNMQADGTFVAVFKKWYGSPPVYSPILTQLSSG
jgi:polar amino acid transport system substrate-binding protein